ncbi:MAG: hypothetical protein QM820_47130 [Minicystis sp.]
MSDPIRNPTAYDFFTIDGVKSPGVSRIKSGGDRAENWQNQQAPGFAGAFTVFRYEEISKLTYEIDLFSTEQFAEWETFVAMLNEGKDRRPPRVYTLVDLRVAHNKITSVAYASVSALQQPTPGEAKWTFEVTFTEYRKRKPTGGPVQPPRNSIETKIDELNKDNAALTKQRDAAFAAARAKK